MGGQWFLGYARLISTESSKVPLVLYTSKNLL